MDLEKAAAGLEGIRKAARSLYPDVDPDQAVVQMLNADRTSDGWAARNRVAIEQMQGFTLSEDTVRRVAELMATANPVLKAELQREFELRKLRDVDWEAFTRHLRANQVRLESEFGLTS